MGEPGNLCPVLAAGRLSQQPNGGMGHRQGGSITKLVNVSIDNPDDGMDGILAKLAMIPKRGEQKMCYRVGLLFRVGAQGVQRKMGKTGLVLPQEKKEKGKSLLSAMAWWERAAQMEPNSSHGEQQQDEMQ